MIPDLTVLEKFDPKPSESIYSTAFPRSFRPEVVDNDVISGKAVDNIGVDVPIKFGDSSSNGFRDIPGADFVSNEHWRIRIADIQTEDTVAIRPHFCNGMTDCMSR